jgi:hypothetical protein
VPRRPRCGLLDFLLLLDLAGVRFGLDGEEVTFDGILPHRRLLGELFHHYEPLRRRLTKASAPWPPEPGGRATP